MPKSFLLAAGLLLLAGPRLAAEPPPTSASAGLGLASPAPRVFHPDRWSAPGAWDLPAFVPPDGENPRLCVQVRLRPATGWTALRVQAGPEDGPWRDVPLPGGCIPWEGPPPEGSLLVRFSVGTWERQGEPLHLFAAATLFWSLAD